MALDDARQDRNALVDVLTSIDRPVVACSGGVDSLTLASVAHEHAPAATIVAHAVTPAVPAAATARVLRYAREYGWNLDLVEPGEFADERYLSNPVDRCYFCKTHLYDEIAGHLARAFDGQGTILSGANLDDLGEYRPGLKAADEHEVRHPFVEAGFAKADIRHLAGELGLDAADLPASPCLASRLYTGTRVDAARLKAVELGESMLTELTGIEVVRCRIREDEVMIEVEESVRPSVTSDVLEAVGAAMRVAAPELGDPVLDDRPYRPGRAFLVRS
ncbi:MAG: ATPase [Actinomycetota bacterium]